MVEKRRIKVSGPDPKEELEDDELPRKFKDIGWKEWLKVDFARYWYMVIVLAIDVLFGLEATNLVSGAGSLGFMLFLAIAVPLQILVYLYLWGKNGMLMSKH
jgi:hypothetical protein